MTSIGAVSAASFLNPASAVQNSGPQATRHHQHNQPTAADRDGDGIPDAPTSATNASGSAASILAQALNTIA